MEQNSIVLLSYSAAHDPVSYFLIVSILSDPLSLKMCANWLALIFRKIVSGGNIGPAAAGPAGPTPTALICMVSLPFRRGMQRAGVETQLGAGGLRKIRRV